MRKINKLYLVAHMCVAAAVFAVAAKGLENEAPPAEVQLCAVTLAFVACVVLHAMVRTAKEGDNG